MTVVTCKNLYLAFVWPIIPSNACDADSLLAPESHEPLQNLVSRLQQ